MGRFGAAKSLPLLDISGLNVISVRKLRWWWMVEHLATIAHKPKSIKHKSIVERWALELLEIRRRIVCKCPEHIMCLQRTSSPPSSFQQFYSASRWSSQWSSALTNASSGSWIKSSRWDVRDVLSRGSRHAYVRRTSAPYKVRHFFFRSFSKNKKSPVRQKLTFSWLSWNYIKPLQLYKRDVVSPVNTICAHYKLS